MTKNDNDNQNTASADTKNNRPPVPAPDPTGAKEMVLNEETKVSDSEQKLNR